MTEPFKSFRWKLAEFEIVHESLNKVKFKATVLKPGLSRNGRMYLTEEVMEAGRTLARQPINVNHNDKKIVGNVDWASVNKETHGLDASGTINKQPYVNMFKMHDPRITGFSVQADFMTGECIHCHKQFKDMETLKNHILNEEHIQNITFAPRGILFNALAVVESPEQPGVPSATGYEITETAKFGTLEEFCDMVTETVTKEEEERKMKNELSGKAALTEETSIAIGKTTFKQPTPVIVEAVTSTQTTPKEPLITEPKVVEAKPAPPDLQKVTERTKIQLTIAPATLKEVKPPDPSPTAKEKLTLGEPFAGYTDFADCVAKNQDKDNPEAYCGSIKHEVEGEMVYRKGVDGRLTEVGHEIVSVNTNVKEIQTQSFKSVESTVEQTNKAFDEVYVLMDGYTREVRAIRESHKSDMEITAKKADLEPITKNLTEVKATVDKKADAEMVGKECTENKVALEKKVDVDSFNNKLTELEATITKKADAESTMKELAETKALILKKADVESLNKELTETKATLAKTTENLAKLEEKTASIEKKYEAILKLAETTNAKNDKTFAELTTENEKLKAQLKESDEKKVKETVDAKTTAEEAKVIAEKAKIIGENNEDKLRKLAEYKGKNKSFDKTDSGPDGVNPITGGK